MNARNTHLERIYIKSDELYENVSWYLVIDQYSFHVYVAVKLEKGYIVRLDWSDDSKLTFSKFKKVEGQKRIRVGKSNFCKAYIKNQMRAILKRGYDLFDFNCRTVSCILLVRIAEFHYPKVYSLFEENQVLCGLDTEECINPIEIVHFLKWERGQHGDCILF